MSFDENTESYENSLKLNNTNLIIKKDGVEYEQVLLKRPYIDKNTLELIIDKLEHNNVIKMIARTTFWDIYNKGLSLKDVIELENNWYYVNKEEENTTIRIKQIINKIDNNEENSFIVSHSIKKKIKEKECKNLIIKENIIGKLFVTKENNIKTLCERIKNTIFNFISDPIYKKTNLISTKISMDLEKIMLINPEVYEKMENNNSNMKNITKEIGSKILINHLKRHLAPENPIINQMITSFEPLQIYLNEIYAIKEDYFVKKINYKMNDKNNLIKENNSSGTNVNNKNKNKTYHEEEEEEKKSHLFEYHQRVDGCYYIISGSSTINFYSQDGSIIATFNVDLIKCGGVKKIGKDKYLFFLGTAYGIVYIIDETYKIITILYFGNCILKIRVIDYRYIIFTNSSTIIMAIDRNKDILIDNIHHKFETILDADIFMDTLAMVTMKKKNTNTDTKTNTNTSSIPVHNFFFKIKDLTKMNNNNNNNYHNNNTDNHDNSRKLIILINNNNNKISQIEGSMINSYYEKQGIRLALPDFFFQKKNDLTDFILRYSLGLFPIDLIHFNGTKELLYKITESINKSEDEKKEISNNNYILLDKTFSAVSIVDYNGNNIIYYTIPY